MKRSEMRKRGLRPGFFAFGAHKELADDSSLEVVVTPGSALKNKLRIKAAGILTAMLADSSVTSPKLEQQLDTKMSTDTGEAGTLYPNSLVDLTVAAETLADGSNDDIELGKVMVVTGNVVEGIIGDIGTATVYRRTCAVNKSGGVVLITVADESNTTINGQGKRLSIVDDGYVVLMETANDAFIILEASGVTLVAFA